MIHSLGNSILLLFLLAGMFSCIQKVGDNKDNTTGKNKVKEIDDSSVLLLENDIKKEIFYGLYSPVEISNMIKGQNIQYAPERFLPASKSNEYYTSTEIALNLGVYGADFSLAKMFNSTSDAITYLEVISEMSDKLGIPQDLIMESAERLEQGMHDMDSLTKISFETFEKSTGYLYENDRASTANLILLGAWIEGLYQITNYINDQGTPDPEIVELIIEQKYSLNFLMSVLRNYYDDPYVAYYYRMLEVLRKYFNKLDFQYKEGQVKIDKENKVIETEWTQLNYTNVEIEKVINIVATIRGIITKS